MRPAVRLLYTRLGWMAALWAAGVAALAVVSWLLRIWLKPA
jgi:hypothetical protein